MESKYTGEYHDIVAQEAAIRRRKIHFMRRRKKMSWTQIANELGISRGRLYQILGSKKESK